VRFVAFFTSAANSEPASRFSTIAGSVSESAEPSALDLSGEVNFGLEEIVEVDEGGSTTNEDLLERRLREEDELAWWEDGKER
jgi:hypothetical protein